VPAAQRVATGGRIGKAVGPSEGSEPFAGPAVGSVVYTSITHTVASSTDTISLPEAWKGQVNLARQCETSIIFALDIMKTLWPRMPACPSFVLYSSASGKYHSNSKVELTPLPAPLSTHSCPCSGVCFLFFLTCVPTDRRFQSYFVVLSSHSQSAYLFSGFQSS